MRALGMMVALLALLALSAWSAPAYEQTVALEEHVGTSWQTDVVHRTIEVPKAGLLYADKVALFDGDKAVPVQLHAVEPYADGSVRRAEVWFLSDLPARGRRTFVLRAVEAQGSLTTDLRISRKGNVLELSNALTAVMAPAGKWDAPEGSRKDIAEALAMHLDVPAQEDLAPGPVLGVKLPSGRWTAASAIKPYEKLDKTFERLQDLIQLVDRAEPAGPLLGYGAEVTAAGPIFARVRLTYRFAADGVYIADVTLRTNEPLVRIDERYKNAGALVVDLGSTVQPTSALYRSNRPTREGKTLEVSYGEPTRVALFVGWDFYIRQVAQALAFVGDPGGDLVGLMSTDPDWLPFPYNQALHVMSGPGPALTLRGNLGSGQRHWALFVAREADLAADPVNEFYRWWYKRLALPLDKVSSWQLVWPGMDEIEFPHTFFSKDELAEIRKSLQAEPAVQELMARLRTRKGLLWRTGFPDAAAYLVSGDKKHLEHLRAGARLFGFLDRNIKHAMEQCGPLSTGASDNMITSDNLLTRFVAMELVLGSDLVTPEERHEILKRLAFLVCQMHEDFWIPPNYTFDPVHPPYPAYVQGTPNQKECYYLTRAMAACMLKGHPKLKEWIEYALEENDRVAPGSLHESGALLESCFYTLRDTMRWGPFWRALERAGATDPRAEEWQERQKRAFVYLTDMLTPPEPRMGGRRVYHPLGRSSPGAIDPTFMIGADPWGLDDEAHRRRMRWAWVAQGRPPLEIMEAGGGRDLAQTLLAFVRGAAEPLEASPLKSKRYEGMGAIFRSQVDSGFESNVIFRHDPFSWNLYETNNGAVYFYGKGAPLLPRFGGHWNRRPSLMSIPMGNRLLFDKGDEDAYQWTNGLGEMTEYAALGELADFASGITLKKDWRRSVLLAKDAGRDDPVYLLVRDDVGRAGAASAVHWWVMSKAVQPDGVEKPGVVPSKGYTDDEWMARLGKNWPNAPKLTGQFHHFTGQCGVDVDMFIAEPLEPVIVTDAAACGPRLNRCINPRLIECQQLVRIEQPAGRGYLTLLAPRWPGSGEPDYKTIAGGRGVAIRVGGREDRLLLAHEKTAFKDDLVEFEARGGFCRSGTPLRLMVIEGRISAGGIALSSPAQAALTYDGKSVSVRYAGARPLVDLAAGLEGTKVAFCPTD